jgi:hypothetical protein
VITVLFARRDSIYKSIPGVDVWDVDRNATMWPGGGPVVAHPPCRSWSRLRAFAKPTQSEIQLVTFAISAVREWGGVLEHPESSFAFTQFGLPFPGQEDAWGGWTISIPQFWWGHKAEKRTWLYIAGCEPRSIPPIPLQLGEASHVVASSGRSTRKRPVLSVADREHTPEAFAHWLIDLASRCRLEVNQ